MTTLPVSLIWLLMLYFSFGQKISDIASVKDLFKKSDEIETSKNYTEVVINDEDEQKENQSVQHENSKARETERENVSESLVSGRTIDNLKNDTSEKKTKIPEESAQTKSSKRSSVNRGKQKFTTQRIDTSFELFGIPSMSPERRNSYLSIAERRRYYNRARGTTKRLENAELESRDEGTQIDKYVTPMTTSVAAENLRVNEISVSKKSGVKDPEKEVFTEEIETEKRNQVSTQKIMLTAPSVSEKLKKFQSRQSVIQSQYEFGQKLNLKKPIPKVPDSDHRDEISRKIKGNPNASDLIETENTTAKFNKNNPVRSTELLRVSKIAWTTTNAPESEVEKYNSSINGINETDTTAEKVRYEDLKPKNQDVESEAVDSNVNANSTVDNRVSDLNNGRQYSEPVKLIAFPLNYANFSTAKKNANDQNLEVLSKEVNEKEEEQEKEEEEEDKVKTLVSNIQNVYNQEILRINATKKPVKVPSSVLQSFLEDSVKNSSKIESETPRATEFSAASKYVSDRTISNRNETILSEFDHRSPDETITNFTDPNNTQTTVSTVSPTKEGQIDPKRQTSTSSPSSLQPRGETTGGSTERTKNAAATTVATAARNPTRKYPLTIELNENNKRILNEMFAASKSTETGKTEKQATATAMTATTDAFFGPTSKSLNYSKNVAEGVQTTFITKTTTTAVDTGSSSTTETQIIEVTKIFQNFESTQKVITFTSEKPTGIYLQYDPDEDRKAMETQYNTKFYISPNDNNTQRKIIKIVETEEEDDDYQQNNEGVALLTRPIGITAYVLIAFGVLPLVLGVVFATKFVLDRRRRRFDCESNGKSDSISTSECQTRQTKRSKLASELKKSPSNVTTTTLVTASRLPRIYHHWISYDKQGNKDWEIPRSKLKLKTILGQGNFGQVWKAEAEDVAGHDGKTRLVAVKTVKEGAGEKEHKEFIKELEIMQQIGSHPNIVTLLGCCTDQEPYYLIMEYVKYGKLLTYLREHRVNENYYNFSNNENALTSKDLTIFSYCISQGMEYLVSRGIIHRDLAARNVLVDHKKVCKIADFGMSRSVRNFEDGQVYEERQHKGALPIRWMAPESLIYSVFTHKSDVWSFGIVMWEIVTLGSVPYPNMGAREIMRRVRDGYRLERPSHCKPEFYRLMSHCWTHDPNKRPDFSELRKDLSNLLENSTKDGTYVDLDRFAVHDGFHNSSSSRELRLLERKENKPLKRLADWDMNWVEETKKPKAKKGKNNGKGTVTLTGHGSFTVNSRILEKEFKMI